MEKDRRNGGLVLAKFKLPSKAVQEARLRRRRNLAAKTARTQWFIDNVTNTVHMDGRQRLALATAYVKDKVVLNLSKPVIKGQGVRGGLVVTNRSKPGEFPRADTTQLMKTIFSEIRKVAAGKYEGYVGTPLDYGAILELYMNRSFLIRTLREELAVVRKILLQPAEQNISVVHDTNVLSTTVGF